ncbi:vitamin D 25-hydroxylase-like [Bradysia coprophila]|uniref:vitamin D 25-hydroxylase-like n=1 Tax=Bradysia coprophila TaxID=38358 RepID=UPI00187DACDD|nr:vitamin D 25-hydroxylase-like [Bradysia coprophila]XP_037036945.1 vitamin D 25-hydroxylase-like [Bradysia coprophila]XP_037036946.1 vitamin D 25-hydroxylase-like [Bradysia coprophila]
MLSMELLLMFVTTLLAGLYLHNKFKYRNFPKGPMGLPIIGYLPFLGPTPHRRYSELAKIYGNIFSLMFGQLPVVVLNDLETIKKAFRHEVFSGRPNKQVLAMGIVKGGMTFSDGQEWTEQRRFTLKILKSLGFGKSSLEGSVKEECSRLLGYFKTKTDRPINCKQIFEISVMNTLWLIIAGESHDYDDPKALRWHQLAYEGLIEPAVAGPVWFMPWLARLAPERTGFTKLLEAVQDLRNEFRILIEKRQATRSKDIQNDFLDYYLTEIEATDDDSSSFYKDVGVNNLIDLLINLFAAGSDTTTATLCWGFLYLLKYPAVYAKWKTELDKIVGRGNLPTLNDRPKMPYTEAVLHELLRITSVTSGGLLHCTTDNVRFEGYDFPKGTIILPNLYGCQHDEATWGDPDVFRPERWLNRDETEFVKDDRSIPFSVGKRICPAEHLSLLNLFIFFTSLIQTFDFEATDAGLPTLEAKPGLVLHPQPYEVLLRLR